MISQLLLLTKVQHRRHRQALGIFPSMFMVHRCRVRVEWGAQELRDLHCERELRDWGWGLGEFVGLEFFVLVLGDDGEMWGGFGAWNFEGERVWELWDWGWGWGLGEVGGVFGFCPFFLSFGCNDGLVMGDDGEMWGCFGARKFEGGSLRAQRLGVGV